MEIYARLTVSTVEHGCLARGLHVLKIKTRQKWMPNLSVRKGSVSSWLGCGQVDHLTSKCFEAREADDVLNFCCNKQVGVVWVCESCHCWTPCGWRHRTRIPPGNQDLSRHVVPRGAGHGGLQPQGGLMGCCPYPLSGKSLRGPMWGGKRSQLVFSGARSGWQTLSHHPYILLFFFFFLHGQFCSMKFAELK